MRNSVKYFFGFGTKIWECQCGAINREGRWYCGQCGRSVDDAKRFGI